MSSSVLGTLPDFGGRGAQNTKKTKSGDISSQLGLDDALDSILGDSTAGRERKPSQKNKTNTKAASSRVKSLNNSDTDFYSQLANQAGDSLDDSDNMLSVTPVDAKKMADSVDVDDMEASLFGSFNRSQNQRRQIKRKNSASSASTVQEAATSGMIVSNEQRKNEITSQPQKQEPKATPTERPQAKKFDFDDDILDLLSDSDSEDKAPKKRVKPKIQLKTASKRDESTSKDDKPITSNTANITEKAGSDFERPRTSHGRQPQTNGVDSSIEPTATEKASNKVDILKLDSTPERRVEPSNQSIKSTRESFNSTKVDFDDEDDDILSGMGLDESNSKPTASSKKQQGSRLDELLGKKQKQAPTPEEPKNSAASVLSGNVKDEEEDGFQFGGYLPSAATDSSGSKLPTSRRRRGSDSLTSRPSSAPSQTKKTVRFAEAVENNDRPSSSPVTNDAPKPVVKGSRKNGVAAQTTVSEKDEGSSFSRKPPLPRKKTEPADSNNVHSEKQETVKPEEGRDVKAESNTTEAEESFVSNNDSLFPWDESTPKQSSLRSRERRSLQQRTTTNALFEDSQEQPEGGENDLHSTGEQPQTQTKFERPTFPWQKSKQTRGSSAGSIPFKSTTDSTSTSAPIKNDGPETPEQFALDQSSLLDSFQGQLLQQQKQMQEQLKTLQSQQKAVSSLSSKRDSMEEERLRGELKSAQNRVKELESLAKQQKSQLSDKQVQIEEFQVKVQTSEEGHKKLEEECKVLNEKMSDLESNHQKTQFELSSQLEELKMKLYKAELERDQLKQSLESTRSRHSEEVESVQKSHEARIKAMEESFQRKEARWREEAEMESIRYQERVQQLEKEKSDVSLALKKKLDALEVSKTNEISRLQDIHFSSVEDLKREHELDKQHLINLHRQEVEALKAAHSHTRMLSELTRQVESSTREVSQLQAKLESTHSKEMQEQLQRTKTHEDQLKTLEERLLRQQTENSAERERLQSLVAKLEMHISQQRKQIEQERWELQQESNRLKIQQTAFEEERMSSLKRIEEDKDHLQQAKERFLSEQCDVLSKCYEERRALASERAEIAVLQKRMQEKEEMESKKSLRAEAEIEATLAQIRDESAHVASETRQLKQDQELLKAEKEAVKRDREKLEVLNVELQKRNKEIEDMHQSAVIMRENGEQALIEARRLQENLAGQSQNLQVQWSELRERETRIASEQLSLAQQRRDLQLSRMDSRSTAIPDVESTQSLDQFFLPPSFHQQQSHVTPVHPALSLPHPPPPATVHDHLASTHPRHSTLNPSLPPTTGMAMANAIGGVYSPRASPVHTYGHDFSKVPLQRPSVKSKLAAIEHSRSLRNLELDAIKDKEELEEENEFLESLQLQNNNVKHLLW